MLQVLNQVWFHALVQKKHSSVKLEAIHLSDAQSLRWQHLSRDKCCHLGPSWDLLLTLKCFCLNVQPSESSAYQIFNPRQTKSLESLVFPIKSLLQCIDEVPKSVVFLDRPVIIKMWLELLTSRVSRPAMPASPSARCGSRTGAGRSSPCSGKEFSGTGSGTKNGQTRKEQLFFKY